MGNGLTLKAINSTPLLFKVFKTSIGTHQSVSISTFLECESELSRTSSSRMSLTNTHTALWLFAKETVEESRVAVK